MSGSMPPTLCPRPTRSSQADAALLLAEQVDAADQRTMPALMREWRAAMAELRAASTVAASVNPFDELRRRRERAG